MSKHDPRLLGGLLPVGLTARSKTHGKLFLRLPPYPRSLGDGANTS